MKQRIRPTPFLAIFFLSLALLASVNHQALAADAPPRAIPGKAMSIDFDNVDIVLFIKFISELTGKNFVVDQDVKGKITVISPTQVSVEEAYKVFESVLEVHGYTTIQTDNLIKVVPAALAKERNINTRLYGLDNESGDHIATQLFRLKHCDPLDVQKLLTPLLPKSGSILAYPLSRMLIITDVLSNIDRLAAIIKEIDVPGDGQQLTILPLVNAAADKAAATIKDVFSSSAAASATPGKPAESAEQIKVVPYARNNTLIILATPVQTERIRELVTVMDKDAASGDGNIHVYYLQNANAEELTAVLNQMPTQAPGAPKESKPQSFSKEVNIVADKATNSLVITAGLNDYQVIESIIEQLDIPRRMVHIEALIMEVNVQKDFQLGAEWMGLNDFTMSDRQAGVLGGFSGTEIPFSGSKALKTSTLPTGFTMGVFSEGITIGSGDSAIVFPNLSALLSAYKQDSDFNILSTPQIMTTDNQEARIQVGENIPYLTKEANVSDQTSYQNYEYKDIGVTLKVTPQISQNGLVRLKIYQEVVKLKGTNDNYRPSTMKRVAETTVIVKDHHTIVIGGIIGEDSNESETGVPLLKDIPVLGHLFKFHSSRSTKTNLFVFLTPTVLSSPDESDALYKKIRQKTNPLNAPPPHEHNDTSSRPPEPPAPTATVTSLRDQGQNDGSDAVAPNL